MTVQQALSYAMGIIKSLGLDTFIIAGLTIVLASVALKALITIFRKD